MRKIINETVRLAPCPREIGGGRSGTVRLTLQQMQKVCGPPHTTYSRGNSDGKVTAIWYFDTPRGPAEVRDYWWNRDDELSIATPLWKPRATSWLAAYFRAMGIVAHCGMAAERRVPG